MKYLNIVLALSLLGAPAAALQPARAVTPASRAASARLTSHVRPQSYIVNMHVDLAKGTFGGEETVTISTDQPVNQFALHALELKLTDTHVTDDKGVEVQISNATPVPQQELINYTTAKQLLPGTYKIRTRFGGTVSGKLMGLYRADFTDRNGKTHKMVATQFEPADARRMIPCFDEPDMKAKFKLTVTTDAKFNAVSNAAVIKETTHGAEKTIEFDTTPPMSSYLLALVIGELEATPAVMVQGTPIRVWGAKGMIHLGTYARDEAAKILPYLNQYFGIPYPWKKLDLVAVPEFSAGAMENPGCITFRESYLLVDPKIASTGSLKGVTDVTAHEMAHLWFGDLVTMKWWDDLWLNEAFATWMATKAVISVHPEWEAWKNYAGDRTHAMQTDSLQSTRTIHFEVKSPDQTHEMFDAITYDKGCSVLRMLERYVGEPVFQKGVQLYLQAHQFGNATTQDLWDGIATASGAPIREMMHSWVHQPGYPLVTVVQTSATPPAISLSQQRFFLDASHPPTREKWFIPVGFRAINHPADQNGQSDAEHKTLVQDSSATVPLADATTPSDADTPIIANAGGVGFFRARYDDPLYARILGQPRLNLDPSERRALISDTSALMTAGSIPVSRLLDLVVHYKDETDDSVWNSMMATIDGFDAYIDTKNRKAYEKFIRDELSQIYTRLGWEAKAGDSPQTRELRGSVIRTLGTVGQDPAVIAEARKRFALYLKDKTSLDRDLIGPVSRIVAHNGTSADYAQFKELSAKATTPEERVRNLYMLTSFDSPALVDQTLALAVSKNVRLQDAPGLIADTVGYFRTSDQGWRFVKTNWAKIRSIFPEEMVPHIVSAAGSFSHPNQLADLKSFVASHPIPSGKTSTARAIETSSIKVQFRTRSAAELNKWVQSHFGV